jgi:hypothetical protein
MIGHLSEHPPTTNSTLASYCSLPTTKVPTIVSMPRVIKPKDEAIRKSELKAKNIQLAVKDYTDLTSGLLLRAAASIHGVSKILITNHLDEQSKIRYASDVYVERQALNAAEETVLCQYIRECYQSHLSFDVELLHYYANHLLQARVGLFSDDKKIRGNWHLRFYQCHPSIKGMRARPFEKDRLVNEDPNEFIRWFQKVKKTIDKWSILPEDTYNMDEEGAERLSQITVSEIRSSSRPDSDPDELDHCYQWNNNNTIPNWEYTDH